MYHVLASIGGKPRRYDLPAGRGTKYCARDVEAYARVAFSHHRCDYVAVADFSGPVGYVSFGGAFCYPQPATQPATATRSTGGAPE